MTDAIVATAAKGWLISTCPAGCCLVVMFEMPNGERVAAQFGGQELVEFSADLRDAVARIRLGTAECVGSA